MHMKRIATLTAVAAAVILSACSSGPSGSMMTAAAASSGPTATAVLEPTKGNTAAGTVTFQQRGDRVMVTTKVTGLKPNQEHGMHAHEKGDCSSGDGMSTGGHFNPNGKPHGPQESEHHAGDMPALKADANGNANASFELSGVTVGSGSAVLVGRGLIVHAAPDDYKTQPTGNSGARIACGVIKQG
ncbi:MAG: superoxide dismutase family protein [Betaproteobacteria bacterium]|nr:MAG: superoxide dismutase family protein [Betaproteobacteria bacterium]